MRSLKKSWKQTFHYIYDKVLVLFHLRSGFGFEEITVVLNDVFEQKDCNYLRFNFRWKKIKFFVARVVEA